MATMRIHSSTGIVEHQTATRAPSPPAPLRSAEQTPIIEIMTSNLVCATGDLRLAALLDVVLNEHVGSVPIVDGERRPVGMVTKLDLVEYMGSMRGLSTVVADVMMPLAITLNTDATLAHAASLLSQEDLHHVMVVSNRRLIGLVSTMDITRWVARQSQLSTWRMN
jgi:CBS domain-containing protein